MLRVKVENTRHPTTTASTSFNRTITDKCKHKLKNKKIMTHVNIDTKVNNRHTYLE
jgi:osmotically-inducible protein OsmY